MFMLSYKCSKENDNSIYYIGHECWLFIGTYDTSCVKLIPSLKGAYQLILNIRRSL
jgi:hypothetical protein